MDSSAFLILGANGQLGKALQAQYPDAQTADSQKLDIANEDSVNSFDWKGIRVVLNAAAYTNVDGAESPEGRVDAWKVNGSGTANLVRAAMKHGFTLVHISTDYVFDGTSPAHTESEPLSPINVYGQSKAGGELAVSLLQKYYLLRTSWVIGDGKNFVRTMISLGEKGISPTVVADQVGRLTFTNELVRAIDHLLGTEAAYGTYNVSNGGEPASWADITRAIFEIKGYSELNVTDTTTKEYFRGKEGVAPRPLKSDFDLSKLESTRFTPEDWRKSLEQYIEQEAKE